MAQNSAPFTCFQNCYFRKQFEEEKSKTITLTSTVNELAHINREFRQKHSVLEGQLEEERHWNEFMFKNCEEVRSEAERLKLEYEIEMSKNSNESAMRRVEEFLGYLSSRMKRVYGSSISKRQRLYFTFCPNIRSVTITTSDLKKEMERHEEIEKFMRSRISRVVSVYGYERRKYLKDK